MSTVVLRMSIGAPVRDVAAKRIDTVRQEAAEARSVWQESGSSELDRPGLQEEYSVKPGVRVRGPVDAEWGRSESLDPDDVGDIADEGAGHRG